MDETIRHRKDDSLVDPSEFITQDRRDETETLSDCGTDRDRDSVVEKRFSCLYTDTVSRNVLQRTTFYF